MSGFEKFKREERFAHEHQQRTTALGKDCPIHGGLDCGCEFQPAPDALPADELDAHIAESMTDPLYRNSDLGARKADCDCCFVVDEVGLLALIARAESAESEVGRLGDQGGENVRLLAEVAELRATVGRLRGLLRYEYVSRFDLAAALRNKP